MKISKALIGRIILIALIVTITLVIFVNSFENIEESRHSSGVITDVIAPSRDGYNDNIELIIRKLAHVIEYAVLGTAVMSLALNLKKVFEKSLYGIALFYVLAVAVVDEHIQSFSGRTSSTGDVLLDFLGALIGFAIVLIIHLLVKILKKRKCKEKCDIC